MPQINTIESREYVECLDDKERIWHHYARYRIAPDVVGGSVSGQGSTINVMLGFNWAPGSEVSVKYRLFLSQFESYQEIFVPTELIINSTFPLNEILDLNHIEWLFETRDISYYSFDVVTRQTVSLRLWRQQGLIQVETAELDQQRQIKIVDHIAAVNQANSDPPLVDYLQIIGNLNKEIPWKISVLEGKHTTRLWQIEVGGRPFTVDDFNSTIVRALREQTRPVLERIPAFLQRIYPESSNHPLEVVVTISTLEPEIPYTVNVTLRDLARELYYSTGVEELDQLILNIHRQLLEFGISVGPENETYQKVLTQLLLYRHHCATKRGYIDASVAQMTETQGFHRHLSDRLGHQLNVVPVAKVFSELRIGNSQVDFLIEDIPTELQLEDRKTATTDDTVERYKDQAADYIARQSSPFGFLLILDTVLDRGQPTSRVDQDVRLTQVTNVSGDSVIVIALIIRIPRPASDHTSAASHKFLG